MINSLLDTVEKRFKIDAHYLFGGGSWMMLGYVVTIASGLLTSYAFANFIPPEVYGQYKYLLTAGVLLGTFSLTGAGTAVIQGVAKKITGFYHFALQKSLLYGLITSFLAASGALYYFIAGNTLLASGLLLIAFLQPLLNSTNLIFSYFNGAQLYKVNTVAHTAKTAFITISSVVALLLTQSVLILFCIYFFSHIISNLLVYAFAGPAKEASQDSADKTRLFNYARHTSFQNILQGIAGQLDKLLVFQNLGAAELATYAFATALPDQYKSVTKSVELLLLPRFSNQSEKSIRSGILNKSIIYFIFLLGAAILYTIFAPLIFSLLFPAYEESIFLSQIYVWGIVFGVGGLPLSALKAEMKNKKLYFFNVSGAAVQIFSVLLLFSLYGLLGVILSKIILRAYLCTTAYIIYYRKSFLKH